MCQEVPLILQQIAANKLTREKLRSFFFQSTIGTLIIRHINFSNIREEKLVGGQVFLQWIGFYISIWKRAQREHLER